MSWLKQKHRLPELGGVWEGAEDEHLTLKWDLAQGRVIFKSSHPSPASSSYELGFQAGVPCATISS